MLAGKFMDNLFKIRIVGFEERNQIKMVNCAVSFDAYSWTSLVNVIYDFFSTFVVNFQDIFEVFVAQAPK